MRFRSLSCLLAALAHRDCAVWRQEIGSARRFRPVKEDTPTFDHLGILGRISLDIRLIL